METKKIKIEQRITQREEKMELTETVITQIEKLGSGIAPSDLKELRTLREVLQIERKQLSNERNVLLAIEYNEHIITLHEQLNNSLLSLNTAEVNDTYNIIENYMDNSTVDLALAYNI
jgi:hypothetical protein